MRSTVYLTFSCLSWYSNTNKFLLKWHLIIGDQICFLSSVERHTSSCGSARSVLGFGESYAGMHYWGFPLSEQVLPNALSLWVTAGFEQHIRLLPTRARYEATPKALLCFMYATHIDWLFRWAAFDGETRPLERLLGGLPTVAMCCWFENNYIYRLMSCAQHPTVLGIKDMLILTPASKWKRSSIKFCLSASHNMSRSVYASYIYVSVWKVRWKTNMHKSSEYSDFGFELLLLQFHFILKVEHLRQSLQWKFLHLRQYVETKGNK